MATTIQFIQTNKICVYCYVKITVYKIFRPTKSYKSCGQPVDVTGRLSGRLEGLRG